MRPMNQAGTPPDKRVSSQPASLKACLGGYMRHEGGVVTVEKMESLKVCSCEKPAPEGM